MKKLFISQPMRGKSDEEILMEREKMISLVKENVDDVEVLDTFFQGYDGKNPLFFLSKSIEFLSQADIAIFAPGWENYRGCRIENICCKEYGVEIIEFKE